MDHGTVIWITGLPSAGKTTLARGVHGALRRRGERVLWLDSDDLREVLTPEPTYTPEERDRVYRTLGRIAARAAEDGIDVLVSATAPRRHHRRDARRGAPAFVEVWLRCGEPELRRRDHRGLYAAHDRGEIRDLPGQDAPYEEPLEPELVLDSEQLAPQEMVDRALRWLDARSEAAARAS